MARGCVRRAHVFSARAPASGITGRGRAASGAGWPLRAAAARGCGRHLRRGARLAARGSHLWADRRRARLQLDASQLVSAGGGSGADIGSHADCVGRCADQYLLVRLRLASRVCSSLVARRCRRAARKQSCASCACGPRAPIAIIYSRRASISLPAARRKCILFKALIGWRRKPQQSAPSIWRAPPNNS